jgi:hypothetical protein
MKESTMPRLNACLAALTACALCMLPLGAADKDTGGVVVDRAKRTVTIDARIAPRKIDDPRYKEIYPVEVIACWPFPRGKKAHETVVTIEAKPSAVHKALESLDLKAGAPAPPGEKAQATGPKVNIYIEVPAPGGRTKRIPVEKALVDRKSGKPMPRVQWRFTGSALKAEPGKDAKVYGADQTGTLIAIFPVTNETVFQTDLTMKDEKYVKLETNKKLLPKEGTPVKLVVEVPASK